MKNGKLHSLNHHCNLVASQGYGDCDKSVKKYLTYSKGIPPKYFVKGFLPSTSVFVSESLRLKFPGGGAGVVTPSRPPLPMNNFCLYPTLTLISFWAMTTELLRAGY